MRSARVGRRGSTRADEAAESKCRIPVKYEQNQRDGRGEKLVEGTVKSGGANEAAASAGRGQDGSGMDS